MVELVIFRGIQGLFGGVLFASVFASLADLFPPRTRARIQGIFGGIFGIASVVGPTIGGYLTDNVGWRWVFWFLLPLIPVVAFITIPPMRVYAGSGTGVVRQSRIATAVLAAAGIGTLVTSLQFANPIAALGGAAIGLAMALPSLRRLLPAGLQHAARGLPAAVLCRILATAAFLGADSFIPLAADRIHGASPTIQGFVIIGASLSWTSGQWFVAHRPDLDPSRTVQVGFAVLTLGLAASIPVLVEGWPLWVTFFCWSIGGFGMGLLFNPTTVAAMSYADEGAEGLVSSQVNLADAIGFSTMGGIGGAMVALSDRTSLTLPGALAINFAIAIGLGCCGVVCARRISARAVSVSS